MYKNNHEYPSRDTEPSLLHKCLPFVFPSPQMHFNLKLNVLVPQVANFTYALWYFVLLVELPSCQSNDNYCILSTSVLNVLIVYEAFVMKGFISYTSLEEAVYDCTVIQAAVLHLRLCVM